MNMYKSARDKAWKILMKFDISSLPVDVFDLCRRAGVALYTYSSGAELIKQYSLEKHCTADAFTAKLGSSFIIFYNQNIQPKSRILFTIGHEIGHISLGHVTTTNICSRSAESSPYETQANIFASRLLAPACVLHELEIKTVEQLQELTGLSYTAAKFRLNRLQELETRDKFYLSLVEKKVYDQFKEFILDYKNK